MTAPGGEGRAKAGNVWELGADVPDEMEVSADATLNAGEAERGSEVE
jgi:hypothetical protein